MRPEAIQTEADQGETMRPMLPALAAVLYATAAPAAVIGSIQVDSGKYVSGSLSAPDKQQQWRVYLKQNQLYAVHGYSGNSGAEVDIRTPSGVVLRRFDVHVT